MKSTQTYLRKLRELGCRLTSARRVMAQVLTEAERPLLVEEVLTRMAALGSAPNKTTVYRELEFLKEAGLILEVDFGEGKKRYELAIEHHHHLICTNCQEVIGVDVEEKELRKQEAAFAEIHGFKVERHMLEFFGLCASCQGNRG